jgi:uncharacterized protein
MGSKKLTLADRGVFREFLALRPHELSVYSFANIYIWQGIFDISWNICDSNLCVFFEDRVGRFLYLAPLGEKISLKALESSFELMDARNKNSSVSRVENVEAAAVGVLEKLGYRLRDKPGEYLCSRKSLSELKGDGYKSKRAVINFFIKHYSARFREYLAADRQACLELYRFWSRERSSASSDPVYRGMLEDNFTCLEKVLADFRDLDLTARVIEMEGGIKAFTAGFKINPGTFCILYEFADRSIKGLSQFIFRRFCQELEGYKYINIMDDSGLKNLKSVKESYRPLKLIPAFIADRKNG